MKNIVVLIFKIISGTCQNSSLSNSFYSLFSFLQEKKLTIISKRLGIKIAPNQCLDDCNQRRDFQSNLVNKSLKIVDNIPVFLQRSLSLYYGVFGFLVIFNAVFNDHKDCEHSHYWIGKDVCHDKFCLFLLNLKSGLLLNSLGSVLSYNHFNFKVLLG